MAEESGRKEMAEGSDRKVGAVMVVGGGIGGMQASLDLADSGYKVYLVERGPSIGGVMAQLDKTFPTNDCAMCTLAPRMVDCGSHFNIEKLAYSEVEKVEGGAGRFKIRVRKKARYIDEEKCTGCGECVEQCLVRNQLYPEADKEAELALKPEELTTLREIVESQEGRKGSIVPILQRVHETYNYLPEDALRYVSKLLGIPLSLTCRIATFYNAFSLTPRGKNIVRVCMGTACYVKGGQRILDTFEKQLGVRSGEATEDLKFSLETVNCLGCCGQSPVAVLNEDIYGYLKQNQVREILSTVD